MRKSMLLFLFLSWIPAAVGQTPHGVEMELESLTEVSDDGQADLMQLAEQLELIREQKMNINTADKYALGELPCLNAFQIHNIIQYIKRFGPIRSPYELLAIHTIDIETAKTLCEYVFFGEREPTQIPWRKLFAYGKHNIIMRWDRTIQEREGYRRKRQQESGYENIGSYFAGDPNRYVLRHRFTFSRHVQFGLTGEKDPGEAWRSSGLGFDFVSAHLSISHLGRIKRIVVGDFQAQFGQGLALWSSLAFNKSAMTLNAQRFGRGLLSSSGVNENRYFRGIGTTIDLSLVDVTVFYSQKRVDASISNQHDDAFSSLQQSGLHRTPSEIASRKALGINSFGGNIHVSRGLYSVGATAVVNQLDAPVIPPEQLVRRNQFTGQHRRNASLDYKWLFRGVQLYGETAVNEQGAFAMANGVYVNLNKHLVFNLHHRDISATYDALYMAPFSETQSSGSGERGTYLGMQWNHRKGITTNAYADHHQFRWLRFRASAPTTGSDYLWQTTFPINKSTRTYSRIRLQKRDINGEDLEKTRPMAIEQRLSIRQHISHKKDDQWEFASRIEFSRHMLDATAKTGWLLFQDIRYRMPQKGMLFTLRYALFDTDDFDARIYAYEHDVLYAFSIPAYFNRGSRFYMVYKWQITHKIAMWFRYAQTYYYQTESIGSGLNRIDGNRMDDVRLQLRIVL